MKKTYLILLVGFVGSIAAFAVCYLVGTAPTRELMRHPTPELAWLKKEFNLGEEEYIRIADMHQQYLPQCARRCAEIEQQNSVLKRLLAETSDMTPQIREAMAKRAQMRADCEAEMLKHFLAVSRTMPADQGRRYLAWIEQQTFLRGEAMEQHHHTGTGAVHHQH